ncbi:TPA: phage repressor protein/antirepressor Ant [Clostridioides difficile]|uniref:phage repressor protein/antirepressor Ant n=2 Tax=Clostridioides difficile TaxID=1496 RepID=UPI00016C6721|nr:phage repressor protein/antirepressor Ant [Clostridioides difficile]EGT3640556.1 phage repressor protein/antirepressor Ant [Clostridioides difficile]EGT4183817.1 phage repressor protein/antirepressor Ant [Clostridioides difficile]EGT4214870.1 phage repressor protein/antirepressor Ant [Clostridioides difficile]EGT4628527.1 phage repressor protein/antirepressor Ant [Clostridioides difficile]EJA6621319.1 phage repressor protein/antirepressor Ant [Clostridioides difficile]
MEIINRENEKRIISFNNELFGEIRTIRIENEPYFVATDIAKALGYKDTTNAIKQHCKWVVKHHIPHPQSKTKTLEVNIIPEGDMYRLITNSELPSAEKFERWVFDEVLPSIREHGAYMTNEALEKAINDPDWTIKLLTELKKERATKEKLKVEQEKNKPKLELANAIESSSSSILIAQLSKILNQNGVDIGQNRLFEWMRNNEYLIRKKRADHNTPTQKSMDLKVLEVSESTGIDKDGNTIVRYTPIVTGKGQIYFLNKILKENSQVLKRFMINNDYIKGVMVEIGKTYAIYDHEYYGFIGILKSVRNEKIRVEEISDVSSSRDIPICMIDYIEEASKEDINKYLSK